MGCVCIFIYIYIYFIYIYIWSPPPPPPMDPPRALIFAKVPQIPIKPLLSGDFPVTGFLTVFLNSLSHTHGGFFFLLAFVYNLRFRHLNLSLQKSLTFEPCRVEVSRLRV